MKIRNAAVLQNGEFVSGLTVCAENGIITAVTPDTDGPAAEAIDLNGDYLIPGFVDVHIHAYKGHDTMEGEESVRHMSRELKKVGVAAFCPTTMSASDADTLAALSGILAVMQNPESDGADVLGAHMEAPFLSLARAGAQPTAFFAEPGEEAWKRYVGDYEQAVRTITMAPELPGAMAWIEELTKRGIAVSLGHTDADAETVHEAVAHGAKRTTHTFNAQTPIHHRKPGVPGAGLTDDRLQCEFIGDGIHLHPDIVRLIVRCKGPAAAVAVTDAMEAAGMPDGKYQLGGQDVFVKNSEARLENGVLAGSTLTMVRALQNLIRFGVKPADAVRMCTESPARAVGVDEKYGSIACGKRAVFARFDRDWQFVETIG